MRILGLAFLLAGALAIAFAIVGLGRSEWTVQLEQVQTGADAKLPQLKTRFPIESLSRYRVATPAGQSAPVEVVAYRTDAQAPLSRALLPLSQPKGPTEPGDVRGEIWQEAMKVLAEHAEPNALVVTWWDNAQRVQVFTGLPTLVNAPVAEAFPSSQERSVWETLVQDMNGDVAKLSQLSKCFLLPASEAQPCLQALLPKDRPVYFLVTVEDLLHASEMKALSGQTFDLRTTSFPMASDIHGAVQAVRKWVTEERGSGYLLQQQSGNRVRAWTVTGSDRERNLLVRLLPFTESIAQPLSGYELVYQSEYGAYLSIYRWVAPT